MRPNVDIQPNSNGLPGIVALEQIVGALLTIGLIAAVAGVALSAIAWAIGSHSSNPHVAGKGKTGCPDRWCGGDAHRRRQHSGHLLRDRRGSGPLMLLRTSQRAGTAGVCGSAPD